MSTDILRSRDLNKQSQPAAESADIKKDQTKSMDFHRQMLENKLREDANDDSQAYVSPSDAIMSPASQKISSFKQRQMNKQMGGAIPKSRSLFAKAMTSREKDFGPVQKENK